MTDLLTLSKDILTTEGFTVSHNSANSREFLVFENATVLGFLFIYTDSATLIANYDNDTHQAIKKHQFGLRRAGQKAWNAYTILLAEDNSSNTATLANIEEDLSGSRKIVRSGIRNKLDLREALLALLPIQAAPRLDAIDMQSEIRDRTTELSQVVINAFLSDLTPNIILQALEEE